MVISREVVNSRLQKLDKTLQVLEQTAKLSFKELIENDILISAVERNFHVAIECILDIGNHIIAEKGFQVPEDNEDIIRILGEEGVIPRTFAEKARGMAGFKNILVHEYTGIDYNLLYTYLTTRLDDFREFVRHISGYLESPGDG